MKMDLCCFIRNKYWSLLFIFLFGSVLKVTAIDTIPKYGPPLRIPLLLSGNFGDIRANSFHFGIDFRTRPGTGFPVYSVADGYVARIKIEPGGYGRVLYINHYNGSSSTYAHLESVANPVYEYVVNEQYKKQSFSQDIIFTPDQFKVKKGDVIGISGNAGLSSGPHLHFEIRETKTQNTTNPFVLYWGMKDSSAPVFKNIYSYEYVDFSSNVPLQKKAYKVVGSHGVYRLSVDKPVLLAPKAFLGAELFDYLTDSVRRLSFYRCKMFVDNELYYELVLDTLQFDQMVQVNGIIDFEYKRKGNIYTMVKWPNLDIRNVKVAKNNGLISPEDNRVYKIRFEASDVTGNKSVLSFEAILDAKYKAQPIPFNDDTLVRWESGATLHFDGCNIVIPEKALYKDARIRLSESIFKGKLLTKPVLVGNDNIVLKKPMRVSYDITSFPEKLRSKLLIASVDGLKSISSLGGSVNRNLIETTSRWFGAFALQVDTIAPGIRLMNIKNGKDMRNEQAIRIKISDELSGIADYKGFIDNKWVLFEYDAKKSMLTYKFDRQRMSVNGSKHLLELVVTDKRDNSCKISLYFIK